MRSQCFCFMVAWLLTGLGGGCSSGGGGANIPAGDDPSTVNLVKIRDAYRAVFEERQRPPRSEEELRAALKKQGDDPYAVLRSPRDGEPYVIIWGVNPDLPGIGSTEESAAIYIHEKNGAGGFRYVVTVEEGGIRSLSDAEFAKASFPKPK